ncbi:acetylornithine deacetylase [Endozoicomonas montiporae]|uniref:Acetylornithine deacetylase n=2 Tax=Endozoicomonas montiporae TaxID=1027273 RepID=A0A081N8T6_9GAMM|nr:hydrolase [Endozoicomonas montiporae]AMO55229.1 glutamate carboxypeptidase [Endozoicomonas montiporae CL-33]KEQ14859.1 acetylornithine deacetylase [Endozoicomonas montiporae]
MSGIIDPFLPLLRQLDNSQNAMLQQTISLAEINSGSLNAKGVNRVLSELQKMTQPLEAEQSIIPLADFQSINTDGNIIRSPLGDALTLSKRPEAPLQVVLGGHMDTVFGADHPFQTIKFLDDDHINGPGVTDLKGGLVVMLHALQLLEQSPWAEHIGWQVIFNPDEEIGSLSSAHLFEDAAKTAHLGMLYEPSFPDGSLAGARKGSGNFTAVCYGKATHAGREHHLGRNAIRALSDFVSAMDDLNVQRENVTFNPGFVHGGGPTNIVPDRCICRFNIRIEKPEDEQWCLNQLQMLVNEISCRDGIKLELHGGFGRKPKVLSPANQAFFQLAKECGAALGMPIDVKATGGCCDGNNLASYGVPNIDTLGVQGGHIHSDQEYMKISSLVPRTKLSAALLMTLAKNEAQGKGNEWLR